MPMLERAGMYAAGRKSTWVRTPDAFGHIVGQHGVDGDMGVEGDGDAQRNVCGLAQV